MVGFPLRMRGRLTVPLSAPVVSDLEYPSDAATSDILSAVTNIISGATYSVISGSGRVSISGSNILKASVPFAGNGSFYLRVSHPDAPTNQQPHVDYGPFSYTVSDPAPGAVLWSRAVNATAGETYLDYSNTETDPLTVGPVVTSGNVPRGVALTTEIPTGVKKRFRLRMSHHASGRARIGFYLKGLFNPATAGTFEYLGNVNNTVAYYPHDGSIRINDSNSGTQGAIWAGGEYCTIDVDTTTTPWEWYVRPDGSATRSGPFSFPAGATGDAKLIPCVVTTQGNADPVYIFDNDTASWPVGLDAAFPGYSALTPLSGGSSAVTVTSLSGLYSEIAPGAIIDVNISTDQPTLTLNLLGTMDPPCTIRALTPGSNASFAGMIAWGSSGFIFQDLDFYDNRADHANVPPNARGEITSVQYANTITFSGCTFRKKSFQTTLPTWGDPVPSSMALVQAHTINVVGCTFTWVGGGVAAVDCGEDPSVTGHETMGVNVIGNEFSYILGDDFCQASRSYNVVFSENTLHDIHLLVDKPNPLGISPSVDPSFEPSHVDIFQVVDFGDTVDYGPYTIEDNLYYRGTTLPGGMWGDEPALAQGIFLASQQPGRYKIGVYIRRNVLYGTQNNAITVNRSQVAHIVDNQIWGFPDNTTGINFQDNYAVTLTGNTAPTITDEGSNTIVANSGNLTGATYVITAFEGPPP